MHSLAPKMGTTSVFIKTLTHWGNEECWEMLPNEAQRAGNQGRRGSWGGSSKPHQPGGLEERCELSQWGSGRSPDRLKIFSLFSALRMACPDTIILYFCGSQKNEKLLTHYTSLFTIMAAENKKSKRLNKLQQCEAKQVN